MVVAVTAVRMVQVAAYEVVCVVAMRYRFVAAARPVLMVLGVALAVVSRGTGGRIGGRDR
jgi:hypothetical protein